MATTPGRGRKLCPSCNKYPGVRSKVCQCGHKFAAKTVAKKLQIKVVTDKITETEREAQPNRSTYQTSNDLIVIIPRGVPPVKLEGTSIEIVRQWMIDTRAAFGDRVYLTHEGLCYLVRYFYPYYKSDENGKCISDNTGNIIRAIIRKIDGVSDTKCTNDE